MSIDDRLDKIEEILRGIDQAIRGNGKPGINVRLDRLEQGARRQARMGWMLTGAVVGGVISMVVILATR